MKPVPKSDAEWEADLVGVLNRIEGLQSTYDRVFEMRAAENSVRATDDVATSPLAIGQHATYCVVQAMDICQGLHDLVVDGEALSIPIAATYPLARCDRVLEHGPLGAHAHIAERTRRPVTLSRDE